MTQTQPLIGIVCGPQRNQFNELIFGVLPAYTRSVVLAGGLPLLVTPNIGEDALRAVFSRLDGVLLAGGGDVDPARYGMDMDASVYGVDNDRDAAEIAFTRWAYEANKPLLGICRGCQVVNVALGGTLYRDIPKEYPDYTGINHSLWANKFSRDTIAHSISVEPSTRLAAALGDASFGGPMRLEVNSLHHQALRDIAAPFTIAARADDGVIEGIEAQDKRFFMGVQWHPEELTPHSEAMRQLFRSFVQSTQA